MKALDFEQMEVVNGGDLNSFACNATAGLFGTCAGFIIGAALPGVGHLAGWAIGTGLAYMVC